MHRRYSRVAAVVATAVAAVVMLTSTVLASAPTASKKPATVKVKQFRFRPKTITVSVGDTVKWKNKDEILHTVTDESDDELFDENLDGAGSTVKVTFDDPGTYEYFCERHTGMTGTVVVE